MKTVKHTINNRHASGFCNQHRTETALIKVNNDSLLAADSGALCLTQSTVMFL